MHFLAGFPFFRKKRHFVIHDAAKREQASTPPKKKSYTFLFLLLCFFFLVCFIWLIFTVSPKTSLLFHGVSISSFLLSYLLIFGMSICFLKVFTDRFIHGISIGLFLIGISILKTNMLLEPFLVLLLLLFLLAIEFAFWQRRK